MKIKKDLHRLLRRKMFSQSKIIYFRQGLLAQNAPLELVKIMCKYGATPKHTTIRFRRFCDMHDGIG